MKMARRLFSDEPRVDSSCYSRNHGMVHLSHTSIIIGRGGDDVSMRTGTTFACFAPLEGLYDRETIVHGSSSSIHLGNHSLLASFSPESTWSILGIDGYCLASPHRTAQAGTWNCCVHAFWCGLFVALMSSHHPASTAEKTCRPQQSTRFARSAAREMGSLRRGALLLVRKSLRRPGRSSPYLTVTS